jgi:hypothetical protein
MKSAALECFGHGTFVIQALGRVNLVCQLTSGAELPKTIE